MSATEKELNRTVKIFDGHNDSLASYFSGGEDETGFFTEDTSHHLDLMKARAGGFAGGLFAVFVPCRDLLANGTLQQSMSGKLSPDIYRRKITNDYAVEQTEKALQSLVRLEHVSGGLLKRVRNIQDIQKCFAAGVLAAVLHFEGAETISRDLNNIEQYYDRGLRSLGLVWSRENDFGHGVDFAFPGLPDSGPGLTGAGKELVRACNKLGIVVDLSHLNEAGFWDVADISGSPLVASHSCVHSLCESPRNLTDRQLDAIGESGGLVGINFSVSFLRSDGGRDTDTSLDVVASHFLYIAERIGVDHVAFGSDFDGATVPDSIRNAAGLQKLVAVLADKGFSESELDAMAHGNWLRILRKTWRE